MGGQPTGRYVTTTVAGESVSAFVPDTLPPRLSAKQLGLLTEPLRAAEAALAVSLLDGIHDPLLQIDEP